MRKRLEWFPYPCLPAKQGRRKFAEDVLTFFSFGRQPAEEYHDFIAALDLLSLRYDLVYRVVRSDGLLPFSRPWLEQTQERPSNEEVYRYLHSSDIHLLPKGSTEYTVVSSTLFLCMGSLVPTVAPNTRHFESLPKVDNVMPVSTQTSTTGEKNRQTDRRRRIQEKGCKSSRKVRWRE